MTGAIRGASKWNFYLELGLDFSQIHRWYKELSSFTRFIKITNLVIFTI